MAALPFDDEAYRAEIPVTALVGEAGWTTLERKGCAPDPRRQRHLGRLPGRGRQDDHPGPRPRASCRRRLVANQDPARSSPRLRDFVAEIAPPGVTVRRTTSTAASRR